MRKYHPISKIFYAQQPQRRTVFMQLMNIPEIQSIEDYIFTLGLLCASVYNLSDLQQKGEELGLFTQDENELAKTVQYRADKLLTCVNDLLQCCCLRGNIDYKELVRKYMEKNEKTERNKAHIISKGVNHRPRSRSTKNDL